MHGSHTQHAGSKRACFQYDSVHGPMAKQVISTVAIEPHRWSDRGPWRCDCAIIHEPVRAMTPEPEQPVQWMNEVATENPETENLQDSRVPQG